MVIKKIFRAFLALFFAFFLLLGLALAYLHLCPNVYISENLLTKQACKTTFYDDFGKDISLNFKQYETIELNSLPPYVSKAFIAVEDKRFYKHNGVDYIGILRAMKNNLFSHSVKQGGSTITQQLIKNTHLSSEKTLERKIKEIKLALKLEKEYSKEQILTFYLNGVYFGEGAYGIESASKTYFSKSAKDLTLVEACALASTVKAPAVYNPRNQKCEERKNLVLKLMKEQGYITQTEYDKAIETKIETTFLSGCDYFPNCLEEVFTTLNLSPYQNSELKIYTYFQSQYQNALESVIEQSYQGAIIMNKQGKIRAFKMQEGDFERSPASTVKPLLVYAPAIEEGVIHIGSKILDQPFSSGDYTPKNYGDKYYGFVSAKDALKQSLNVPAVKVLNALGIEKARLYARKLGFEIKNEGLSVALGSLEKGVNLKTLCSAYTCFLSKGNAFKPTFVKKIICDGKTIYQDENCFEKVFSHGCVEIINQCLNECAVSGTAKAIGKKDYPVFAKTGTNGNEKGNLDAYTICYTSEDIIGVRFCNKDNGYLDNSLTGGHVAKYANKILDLIYETSKPSEIEKSEEVTYANMCLLSYENGELALACDNQPTRYIFQTPILTKYLKSVPISSFSNPSIDFEVVLNGGKVTLEITKNTHVYYQLERTFEGKTTLLYDGNDNLFSDNVFKDGIYEYKLTPYVILSNGQKSFGAQSKIKSVKICIEEDFKNKDWWEE